MRVLLISRNHPSRGARRVFDEFHNLGADPEWFLPQRLTVPSQDLELMSTPDVVMSRILGDEVDISHMCDVYDYALATWGPQVAVVNPPPAVLTSASKRAQASMFEQAGLPIPGTLLVGPSTDPSYIFDILGSPVVVKTDNTMCGRGVFLAARMDTLVDALSQLGSGGVAQRFLPAASTTLRLVVVGGSVVASCARIANGTWLANVAAGADVVSHEATIDQISLAVAAARVTGLDIAGVDIVDGGAPVLLEVNSSPGLVGVESASGVNVAAEMAAWCVRLGQTLEAGS